MNLLLSSALQWNVEFILINTSCLCLSPFSRALSHAPASLHINQTQHCKLLPGMVSSQAQLCRSNLELMQTIIQAAREVKKTCQKTFADMRWNCSSIDIPGDAPKYRPDLDRGMVINSFRKDRADAVSKETLQVFFFFLPARVWCLWPHLTFNEYLKPRSLSAACLPVQFTVTREMIPSPVMVSVLRRHNRFICMY